MTNKNPFKPKSIDEQGGIDAYLDLPHVIEKHNGLHAKDFARKFNDEVPNTKIAEQAGIKSTNTVKSYKKQWLDKFGNFKSFLL